MRGHREELNMLRVSDGCGTDIICILAKITPLEGSLRFGIEGFKAAQPCLRLRLDFCVVGIQRSWPRPVGKGIREAKLSLRGHFDWIVKEYERDLEQYWGLREMRRRLLYALREDFSQDIFVREVRFLAGWTQEL